jgi:hypothetical protein
MTRIAILGSRNFYNFKYLKYIQGVEMETTATKEVDEEKDTPLEKINNWTWNHLPHWLCRIPRHIRDFGYEIKYLFQKVLRKHHSSDKELWNLYDYLIKFIYPKLKAFKKMKRTGYPSMFCDYEDDMVFESKEQYEDYVKNSDMIGGGPEAWEKVLDEMIFACEYILHKEYEKKYKNFYKNWGLEDPYAEIEENKCDSFIVGEVFYFNVKLEMEYEARAQKGIELMGKYLFSLWD